MLLAVKLAILSEVMLFGALFAAYFVIRGESSGWPPSGHLERPELLLPGLNSILLISSSVTMQIAVRSARVGDRSRILRWLGLTLLLGGVFLLIQGYEFSSNGFGLDAGVFGSTFYILTGFHGAHVLAGLVLITIVANGGYMPVSPEARSKSIVSSGKSSGTGRTSSGSTSSIRTRCNCRAPSAFPTAVASITPTSVSTARR